MDKHLHIVCHEIPWPVKHGGLIDLFYKIKTLHKAGISIHLHCFYKNNCEVGDELKNYCAEIYFYRRKKLPAPGLPYIVSSRNSEDLKQRLLQDNYPILLEGIHCTSILMDEDFNSRKVVTRLHNVEHIYYERLYNLEKGFRKIYFGREARLLKKYEKALAINRTFLSVSAADCKYYKTHYASNCHFLPVFLPWQEINSVPGKGTYCLYHGNLSISENISIASELLDKIDPGILKIAGYNPPDFLVQKAKDKGVELITSPPDTELAKLIKQAHINFLPSLNFTGVKLKILNALFNGRYCLTNIQAIEGSGLEQVCNLVEENNWKEKITGLMNQSFTNDDIIMRKNILQPLYNNEKNADTLIAYLY